MGHFKTSPLSSMAERVHVHSLKHSSPRIAWPCHATGCLHDHRGRIKTIYGPWARCRKRALLRAAFSAGWPSRRGDSLNRREGNAQ